LGAFTGANIHAVSNLNREFDRRKEEITQLKEELEKSKREHEAHVADLMKTSEDKYNELRVKIAFLQVDLQNEKISNVAFRQRIDSLEKQCEDATVIDVFVTSECIHLCSFCLVTRCLFQDVSIM